MPAFLRKLMSRLPSGLLSSRAPQATLGAFGKHPGWNDHIDPDIGLDARLVEFKQVIYLDGIRDRAIPSWHKADPEQLIPFQHIFAWRANGDVVVGRMWYSRDGRGRDDFPMVVAAHTSGLPLSWALANALPLIDRAEGSLRRSDDRQVAISTVEQANQDLAAIVQHASVADGQEVDAGALATLIDAPDVGETGLLRVLHVLKDSDFGQTVATHAEQVRVPRVASTAAQGIRLWAAAIEAVLGIAPSMLFFAPIDQTWLDILVGLPDPGQFLALRSSLKLIPLTTEIAYTIDSDFSAQKRALLIQARALAGVK